MEAVREIVQRLKTMRKRTFITQLISFGLIVSSALMIWKVRLFLFALGLEIVFARMMFSNEWGC